MRTINTLAELRAERQRLYAHKAFLEAEIRMGIQEVKEDLKPLTMITKYAKTALTSKDNSVISDSVGSITNALLKNVVLRNAGWITKLVVPFLAKNVASNAAENHKFEIAGFINKILDKFNKRKAAAEA